MSNIIIAAIFTIIIGIKLKMSNIIIAAIFTIIIGIVFGLCKKYFDMDIARLYDGLALYFLILILINTINKNNAE